MSSFRGRESLETVYSCRDWESMTYQRSARAFGSPPGPLSKLSKLLAHHSLRL